MYFCKLQQLSNIRTYWGRSEWFAFGLGQLVCIANKDIARLLFTCSWAKLFGCNKAGCKWRWWVRWSSSQGVSLKTASWSRQQKCTWALVIAQHRGSLYVCSFAHGECQGAGLDGSGHPARSLLPQLWGQLHPRERCGWWCWRPPWLVVFPLSLPHPPAARGCWTTGNVSTAVLGCPSHSCSAVCVLSWQKITIPHSCSEW